MKQILEKIKGYYNGNKQKVLLFGSVALVMLIIIIAIAVAMKIIGFKVNYETLEDRLEVAASSYLRDNPSLLPSQMNPTLVISATTLVENKYIKDIQKMVNDSSCTANVLVDYENNDYKYQAYLTCNKFKTEKFVDKIKENNTISQVGEGLYEMNNELVFRGQNPNNYVSFANRLWRIVKINKDGNINMIIVNSKSDVYEVWDDRYNTEKDSKRGINNFLLSRTFSTIKDYYSTNLKEFEPLLAPYDLCVGKRLADSVDKSGRLECNELIEKQYIGLLPIYDYMNASLDALCQTTVSQECQNYNYLADNKYKWWTMTADMATTYDAFYVTANGKVESTYANGKQENRYVVAISSNALYKNGKGTLEEPYMIR